MPTHARTFQAWPSHAEFQRVSAQRSRAAAQLQAAKAALSQHRTEVDSAAPGFQATEEQLRLRRHEVNERLRELDNYHWRLEQEWATFEKRGLIGQAALQQAKHDLEQAKKNPPDRFGRFADRNSDEYKIWLERTRALADLQTEVRMLQDLIPAREADRARERARERVHTFHTVLPFPMHSLGAPVSLSHRQQRYYGRETTRGW
ncbi:hypothetical protein JCM10207_005507 [Rhodosporidiobolus poonsookiae]